MTPPKRTALPQAFFLPDGTGGQRFCLFYPSQGEDSLGRVLYLHPFAEELNTTRRVVAQQARALSQAGYAVLQIDLLGCGDSSGDFADATWPAWLADAQAAQAWLSAHASGPLWLWGLRSGALLAAQLASQLHGPKSEPAHLLLWQPVASGQQMLQQFLRLHAASQWLGDGSKGDTPAQTLACGHPVNIAGYTLSPALAHGLGAARMQAVATAAPGQLVWLESSTQPEPSLGQASTAQLDTWRSAGWSVRAQAMSGPAFWQTVGTDEAPALMAATLQAMNTHGEPAT